MDASDQHDFDVRVGWGPAAVGAICRGAHTTIVVDVLSFTTAADVAGSRGAIVHPVPWQDDAALERAEASGAVLAGGRRSDDDGPPWSLSPASLLDVPPGTRLALTSPNGATVSAVAGDSCVDVIAGCLRNASAVAAAAGGADHTVAIVAAGERWPDGQLRVAVEDLIGAGAIVARLIDSGSRRPSPEARAAAAAFNAFASDLEEALLDCVSGRELVARHFEQDVVLAAQLDVSATVPRLQNGAFRGG